MSRTDDWRPGPEVERAHHFHAAFCHDPNCGLHIVPARRDGSPICEIVMSASQTLAIVELAKDFLYDKATRKNDNG